MQIKNCGACRGLKRKGVAYMYSVLDLDIFNVHYIHRTSSESDILLFAFIERRKIFKQSSDVFFFCKTFLYVQTLTCNIFLTKGGICPPNCNIRYNFNYGCNLRPYFLFNYVI